MCFGQRAICDASFISQYGFLTFFFPKIKSKTFKGTCLAVMSFLVHNNQVANVPWEERFCHATHSVMAQWFYASWQTFQRASLWNWALRAVWAQSPMEMQCPGNWTQLTTVRMQILHLCQALHTMWTWAHLTASDNWRNQLQW